jgi:hypothetical protein
MLDTILNLLEGARTDFSTAWTIISITYDFDSIN